jgi:protein tyrosine/serine phosphatase
MLLAAAAAPVAAQTVITTPILSSVSNFRDIAGVATSMGGSGLTYSTANDGEMRTGVFYRSSNLARLSTADKATLATLGITEDIDLRTPSEVSGGPQVQNLPAGMAYVNVNVFGTSFPSIPNLGSSASAQAYLEGLNRAFVTDPTQRANLATVFNDLANGTGPMMYNCSSGKDRTGWVSAMLQSISGMSSSDIMANYLATNNYSAASIAAAAAISPAYGTILGVQAPDLQAGLDQIIASYGSLDNYLMQGLGLSQAEIYVLRAKMVDYQMLPGQAQMTGNAAAGAALLNALQNSPLSGRYTAYNYYLQSSIDAGTLGGVENQVGGQVLADTASYMARLPTATNTAIAPYISGIGLNDGQTKIWEANLANVLSTNSDNNVASTTSRGAGLMVGATHRIGTQVSLDAGIGYVWGSTNTQGATDNADAFLITAGGRYAFSALEAGPYVSAGGNADIVQLHDSRPLSGGLGTASGNSNGTVFDGHAEIGDLIPSGPFIYTPQLGVDVTNAALYGFTETGSSLSLAYSSIVRTIPSMTASIAATMPGQQAGEWTITPTASLAYIRLLNSPVMTSNATVYGYPVTQISAFNSRDLGTIGMNVAAVRGPLSVEIGMTGIVGDANYSTGIAGNLAITYKF